MTAENGGGGLDERVQKHGFLGRYGPFGGGVTAQALKRRRDWEAIFREWAKPPTATEESRCENAVSVVRNAIQQSDALRTRDVRVFAQGSYRNGTNVRAESDVDVCVCCYDTFFFDLPAGFTPDDASISTPARYGYKTFRRDVIDALEEYLGKASVTVGNKCIDLHENTYRVDADVVPTFEHRLYYRRGGLTYLSGTELHPVSAGRIINWPEQNAANATAKNVDTGYRFKKIVRALKRLRIEMEAIGQNSAKGIPSYLIECLVCCAPNESFAHGSYVADVQDVLLEVFGGLKSDSSECESWTEINGIKPLFGGSQPWTRMQALRFVLDAWSIVEGRS